MIPCVGLVGIGIGGSGHSKRSIECIDQKRDLSPDVVILVLVSQVASASLSIQEYIIPSVAHGLIHSLVKSPLPLQKSRAKSPITLGALQATFSNRAAISPTIALLEILLHMHFYWSSDWGVTMAKSHTLSR